MFDPYYTWLGIPPEEQPPNHYRLLGIQVFESNQDVIAHAADRQMGHIRMFQTGRFSCSSQQILNQISSVRICLLNLKSKDDYDRKLKEKIVEEMIQQWEQEIVLEKSFEEAFHTQEQEIPSVELAVVESSVPDSELFKRLIEVDENEILPPVEEPKQYVDDRIVLDFKPVMPPPIEQTWRELWNAWTKEWQELYGVAIMLGIMVGCGIAIAVCLMRRS